MTAGRIATYTHSDKSVPNKGAAMVRVLCTTDFCARTPGFVQFSDRVARYAFGFGQDGFEWTDLVKAAGYTSATATLEDERVLLAEVLKEPIVIDQIMVMHL